MNAIADDGMHSRNTAGFMVVSPWHVILMPNQIHGSDFFQKLQ